MSFSGLCLEMSMAIFPTKWQESLRCGVVGTQQFSKSSTPLKLTWLNWKIPHFFWNRKSRWVFSFFLIFSPIWGRWTHFDSYFSKGLVQPPTRNTWTRFMMDFPASHVSFPKAKLQAPELGSIEPVRLAPQAFGHLGVMQVILTYHN